MLKPFDEKSQKQLLITAVVGIVLLFICGCILHHLKISLIGLFPLCTMYQKYHLYCPGCGGTRAFLALLHGDIIRSFCYHPFVLYAAVISFLFIGSNVLYRVRFIKHRFLLRAIYFYLAIAIILVQWGIKNIVIWTS